MNIVAISGSLRKESFNTALLHNLQGLAPAGMEITILDISTLPFFNQDLEVSVPETVKELKNAIENADGVIFAMPEHNRSVPGVLTNAIEWISRPYGQNSFAGKTALVMGVSIGHLGTAIGQSHLRQILTHLDMRVIGQPEIYLGTANDILDEKGIIVKDATKDLLKKALVVLAERAA